jgi:sugar phosphate isomerase/epimerase
MDKTILKNTELCIYTWFGFRLPFEEIVRIIKKAGFQSVMTWWGDEFKETDGYKENKPGIIRNEGLKLDNVHFPFTGINTIWENTLDGQEIFNMFYSYIGDCKIYEIPIAVMHVTSGDSPPPYCQLGLDRFKRLIERAEKDGVIIALENLRKPEYLDYIFENIKSDKLKFCYDSGHENCYTPDIDLLGKYGDKLVALHLHDNYGTSDQHLLPFNGTVNWDRIMTQLKKLNYKGSLALEIDAQYIDVSKEFTAQEYLNEAINRVNRLMNI